MHLQSILIVVASQSSMSFLQWANFFGTPPIPKKDLHIFTLILHDYVKQCKCISFTLALTHLVLYTCTYIDVGEPYAFI